MALCTLLDELERQNFIHESIPDRYLWCEHSD